MVGERTPITIFDPFMLRTIGPDHRYSSPRTTMAPDYLHALEKASRNDIYANDDEETHEAPNVADDSDALQERLKRMLHESLGFDLPDSPRPKKKRKVSEAPQEQKDELGMCILCYSLEDVPN